MIRNKMKKIKDFIRRLIKDDIAYLVLNHFINNIPFWSVRRMFYKMGGGENWERFTNCYGCNINETKRY